MPLGHPLELHHLGKERSLILVNAFGLSCLPDHFDIFLHLFIPENKLLINPLFGVQLDPFLSLENRSHIVASGQSLEAS